MAIKILAVLDHLPNITGGAEVSAYMVLRGLVNRGYHIYILTDKRFFSKSYCKLLTEKDGFVGIYSCFLIYPQIRPLWAFADILSIFLSFLATLRYVKIIKPNIIFTHKCAGLGATLASKLLGVPCVYVVRGYQHVCFNWEKVHEVGNKIERCNLQKCDFTHLIRCVKLNGGSNIILRIIQVPYSFYAYFALKLRQYAISRATVLVAISDAVKQSLEKVYPRKHIVKIYNPVDTPEPHVLKVNHDPYNKFITYAGRLTPSKGVDVLLKAFRHLLDKYPKCKLAIIGEGPEMKKLQFLAIQLGIEKSVIFLGPMNFRKLFTFLKEKSFVTVVPSLWDEAFGRVIIESMAAGAPVIASNLGGMRELISNEENGLLVNIGNEKALFNAMKLLIENKVLYEKMVTNALSSVKKYSLQNIVTQYEIMFRKLIAGY